MPLVHSELADRDTLLGEAQRGRGSAYRALLAADADTVSDVVTACVVHDPRCDTQLDTRSAYYGALVVARDVSLDGIVRHLRAEPKQDRKFHWTGTELAVEVLADAALRGHVPAHRAVVDYTAVGAHWSEVAHDLARREHDSVEVHDVIANRFPDDDDLFVALRDATYEWTDKALAEWSAPHPRLATAVGRLEQWHAERKKERHEGRDADEQRPTRPSPTASTADLLDLVAGPGRFAVFRALSLPEHDLDRDLVLHEAQHGDRRRRDASIRALGAKKDDVLLDFAPEMVTVGRARDEDTPEDEISGPQFAAYYALQQLDSVAAAERARAWVTDDTPLGSVGWIVLVNANDPRDDALIRDAYSWLHVEDVYLACSVVDSIRANKREALIDVVRELFRDSTYDYLRARCVDTLLELDAGYASSTDLEDCLWDASSDVRESAVKVVDSAAGWQRLRELASDRHEDEDVRAAAQARLDGDGSE